MERGNLEEIEKLIRFPPEKSEIQQQHVRNQTINVVDRSMSKEAKQELNYMRQNFNSDVSFCERMKKEANNFEKGKCLNGGLGFIYKDRAKFWNTCKKL